jgi:hypothetical protein
MHCLIIMKSFLSSFFTTYHRIIFASYHRIIHHFASFKKGKEGKLLLHLQMWLIYEAKGFFVEEL